MFAPKMCSFSVLLLISCCVWGTCCKQEKFFRRDYQYLPTLKSFYKLQTLHKTWSEAKNLCEMEGAMLWYPVDELEAKEVLAYWVSKQDFHWIYLGISAHTVPGVFETVDGRLIEEVYNNWEVSQPHNKGGMKDCVFMRQVGTFYSDVCNGSWPFICKKTEASLRWNNLCDIPDPEYKYYEKTGRCYKFHLKPRNWADAYLTCSAEQSKLAVINSDEEANIFVELTNNAHKDTVEENYVADVVHLGFKNIDGWKTPWGQSLKRTGYAKWREGQPDNPETERCGSMLYNGLLNDIGCDVKGFFICEHEIRSLQASLDYKFGENH